MNEAAALPLAEPVVEALRGVCTATLTTVLLKKGLRNVWMRNARPLQATPRRRVGRAFTLRFVPAREDLRDPRVLGRADFHPSGDRSDACRRDRRRRCDGRGPRRDASATSFARACAGARSRRW